MGPGGADQPRPLAFTMGVYHISVLNKAGPVGSRVTLGAKPVTIGRHPDNKIAITDDLASRFHCVVEPSGDGSWRVRDLGSRNGTRVNGARVDDALVGPGDKIAVGEHLFEIAESREPAHAERSNGNSSRAPDAARSAGVAAASAPVADVAPLAEPTRAGASKREQPQSARARGAKGAHSTAQWIGELRDMIRAISPSANLDAQVSLIDARGKTSEALKGVGEGAMTMRLFLLAASIARATDIHIEPKGDSYQTRMRVDGQMLDVVSFSNGVGELAIGLVKGACHMKSAGRDAILEGNFSTLIDGMRVDYRASITPSVHGQKLVVRVLNCVDAPERLIDMGLSPYMYERLAKASQQDAGMVLACGPTGSGKTTTLYNILREIDREHRNVITIEDPVEYHLDRVTQIPANIDRGATFGSLLRSVLRQDPDVILLGEIRDEESARVAMQAAMTGHLVFSTVHSKDTIGAVFRLLDLGVESYLVANSLNFVLAQRLVRMLCEHCKRSVAVTPGQATRIGKFLEGKHEVYIGTGCARCLRTGYRGRRAIFEMLEFNNDLRDVVLSDPTIHGMRRIIEQGHFTTLVQSGWLQVARGYTSLDEVDRVAGAS